MSGNDDVRESVPGTQMQARVHAVTRQCGKSQSQDDREAYRVTFAQATISIERSGVKVFALTRSHGNAKKPRRNSDYDDDDGRSAIALSAIDGLYRQPADPVAVVIVCWRRLQLPCSRGRLDAGCRAIVVRCCRPPRAAAAAAASKSTCFCFAVACKPRDAHGTELPVGVRLIHVLSVRLSSVHCRCCSSTTRWPKKASHYHESSVNRLKTCH